MHDWNSEPALAHILSRVIIRTLVMAGARLGPLAHRRHCSSFSFFNSSFMTSSSAIGLQGVCAEPVAQHVIFNRRPLGAA